MSEKTQHSDVASRCEFECGLSPDLFRALQGGAGRLSAEERRGTRDFLLQRRTTQGGYRGRAPDADLYYTAFALESLSALGAVAEAEAQSTARFVAERGAGDELDLIHLCCLGRARAQIRRPAGDADHNRAILANALSFECTGGGFDLHRPPEAPTAYGAFLVRLLCESLGQTTPASVTSPEVWERLRTPDGGLANAAGLTEGTAPAAAAALLVRPSGTATMSTAAQWLVDRQRTDGSFPASPYAPIGDLLSTATALFGLSRLSAAPPCRPDTVDAYVASLRTPEGGYRGHILDDQSDVEYTFYALLALGSV